MGGHPWFYFVAYQSDINSALQELRRREFGAGRYNPVMWMPPFPVEGNSPSPGARHASIEEAMEAAAPQGDSTRHGPFANTWFGPASVCALRLSQHEAQWSDQL